MASISYKSALINWITHLKKLSFERYLVLCLDYETYEHVGRVHGVHINFSTVLNKYFIRDRIPLNVTLRKKGRKQANMTSSNGRPFVEAFKFSSWLKKVPERIRKSKKSSSSVNSKKDPRHYKKSSSTKPSRRLRVNTLERQSTLIDLGKNKQQFIRYNYVGRNNSKARLIKEQNIKYYLMMFVKHSAIYQLLIGNVPVMWSDVDAVWVGQCSISFIQNAVFIPNHIPSDKPMISNESFAPSSRVNRMYTRKANRKAVDTPPSLEKVPIDFLGQKGLTPATISKTSGACICAGFYLANPTDMAAMVELKVKNTLLDLIIKGRHACDQTVLNDVLASKGAYYVRTRTGIRVKSLPVRIAYSDDRTNSIQYIGDGSKVQFARSARHFHLESAATSGNDRVSILPYLRNASVGMLPYNLFPRGAVTIPRSKKRTASLYRAQKNYNNARITKKRKLSETKSKSTSKLSTRTSPEVLSLNSSPIFIAYNNPVIVIAGALS
jgi:hypothetical protein